MRYIYKNKNLKCQTIKKYKDLYELIKWPLSIKQLIEHVFIDNRKL